MRSPGRSDRRDQVVSADYFCNDGSMAAEILTVDHRTASAAPLTDPELSGCGLGVRRAALLVGREPRRSSSAWSSTMLTEHGALKASRIGESPFTDVARQCPDATFAAIDLDRSAWHGEQVTRSTSAAV